GEEIVKKLSLYKLRAKVEISKMSEEFTVLAIINKDEAEKAKKIISNNSNNLNNSVYFPDPRNSEMGLRIFASQQDLNLLSAQLKIKDDLQEYNHQRLNLKIADDNDLTYDKSLILEFG